VDDVPNRSSIDGGTPSFDPADGWLVDGSVPEAAPAVG